MVLDIFVGLLGLDIHISHYGSQKVVLVDRMVPDSLLANALLRLEANYISKSEISIEEYESAFHVNMKRSMAWSKKGSPAIVTVPKTRVQTTAISGTISASGLINNPVPSAAAKDEALLPTTTHTVATLEHVVHRYAARRTLDDCAHNNIVQFRQTAEAHIRPKTAYGSDNYELSLYIGHLELPVIGGFIGDIVSDRCSAFLGSSIRGLPNTLQQSHTTSKILVRADDPVEYTASNRLLRQYAKYCSRFLWSFHSRRFVLKGFHPANPLDFSSHPSVTSMKRYQTHSIVSSILGCIFLESVIHYCHNFSAVKASLPKAAGKTTYITCIIAILESFEQAVETNDEANNLLSELPALKQMTIALMNDGYAIAL
ncbi:hypothetical protein VTP01DRAFT_5081 [Rhizomucor pusillus]|uniref:uncharacterized protein n=1 Tax=Rhizomucor pusillus TaxID=4840 RepID=UPI003743D504